MMDIVEADIFHPHNFVQMGLIEKDCTTEKFGIICRDLISQALWLK
jgi:hypothetical protein